MIPKKVTVTVDRPKNSHHPKYNDLVYPINYGYVKGFIAGDQMEQDAYILGVDHPVSEFSGIVIAVIRRKNDCEDKWVVAPDGKNFSEQEIFEATYFQERFFESEIVMLKANFSAE